MTDADPVQMYLNDVFTVTLNLAGGKARFAVDLDALPASIAKLVALAALMPIVAGMGGEDPDASRRVDMLVYRLRKKARSGLGQDLPLRSAYGEGYSLSAGFTLA